MDCVINIRSAQAQWRHILNIGASIPLMEQFSRESQAKIPTVIKWNSEYTLKMGDNSLESGRTVWFCGKTDIGNGSQPKTAEESFLEARVWKESRGKMNMQKPDRRVT